LRFDDLSKRVIGFAVEVNKELSPGLLENAYKKCLAFELRQSGINFEKTLKDLFYKTFVPFVCFGVNRSFKGDS
jgi:GxxExxY protein